MRSRRFFILYGRKLQASLRPKKNLIVVAIGKCKTCLLKDCGECVPCADKPKFGGPGIKKKGCIQKKQACLGQVSEEEPLTSSVNTRKRSTSPASSPDKKPRCDHDYGRSPVDGPVETDFSDIPEVIIPAVPTCDILYICLAQRLPTLTWRTTSFDSFENPEIMSDFKRNKELTRQLIFDLKCSICKDLPSPNEVRKFRYACQNGHLVCEDCKLLECFCKSKSYNGPLKFVENVFGKVFMARLLSFQTWMSRYFWGEWAWRPWKSMHFPRNSMPGY